VHNVSLTIADKEFLTLLGPSGSGKTTTMRLIAGLDQPTAGEIYIGGKRVNDLAPKDRDVAMVFQSYALYPHMTVYNNLAFPLRMRKHSKDRIDEKVKKTADLLKISELLERKPKQLSGGQQQRVALGRAIVREPKVFLMDEPLSNLDAKLRIYMRAELKALQKRLGITTIYVTHDQLEAMTMADRIAIMNNGCLLQTASPDDIYVRPTDIFVAGFIGSPPMNFVDCSLLEEEKKIFLHAAFCHLDVTYLNQALQSHIGDDVILGIRPEEISILDAGAHTDGIRAEVYVAEPLGSETIISAIVGDTIAKVRVPPTLKVSPGKTVWLSFDLGRIHIFDKKTGKALV
jgi:multiple sugar transport system ATP-binding protein